MPCFGHRWVLVARFTSIGVLSWVPAMFFGPFLAGPITRDLTTMFALTGYRLFGSTFSPWRARGVLVLFHVGRMAGVCCIRWWFSPNLKRMSCLCDLFGINPTRTIARFLLRLFNGQRSNVATRGNCLRVWPRLAIETWRFALVVWVVIEKGKWSPITSSLHDPLHLVSDLLKERVDQDSHEVPKGINRDICILL